MCFADGLAHDFIPQRNRAELRCGRNFAATCYVPRTNAGLDHRRQSFFHSHDVLNIDPSTRPADIAINGNNIVAYTHCASNHDYLPFDGHPDPVSYDHDLGFPPIICSSCPSWSLGLHGLDWALLLPIAVRMSRRLWFVEKEDVYDYTKHH